MPTGGSLGNVRCDREKQCTSLGVFSGLGQYYCEEAGERCELHGWDACSVEGSSA
jgi:hypothetical protein